jgi:hypothetical protein
MPLLILHHLLNVFVQLANKRGFTKKKEVSIPLLLIKPTWISTRYEYLVKSKHFVALQFAVPSTISFRLLS